MLTYKKDFDKSYAVITGFKDNSETNLVFSELRVKLDDRKESVRYRVYGLFTDITHIRNNMGAIVTWQSQLCYFTVHKSSIIITLNDGTSRRKQPTLSDKFLFNLFSEKLKVDCAYSGFIDLSSLTYEFVETEINLTQDDWFPGDYKNYMFSDFDALRNRIIQLEGDYNILQERYRRLQLEYYTLEKRFNGKKPQPNMKA